MCVLVCTHTVQRIARKARTRCVPFPQNLRKVLLRLCQCWSGLFDNYYVQSVLILIKHNGINQGLKKLNGWGQPPSTRGKTEILTSPAGARKNFCLLLVQQKEEGRGAAFSK